MSNVIENRNHVIENVIDKCHHSIRYCHQG